MVNSPVFKPANLRQFLNGLIPTAATTDKVEGLKIALSTVLQSVEKNLQKVGFFGGLQFMRVDLLDGCYNVGVGFFFIFILLLFVGSMIFVKRESQTFF